MSTTASQTGSTKKIGKAVQAAIDSGAPNNDLSRLPDLVDMSSSSITSNVQAINALCENKRQKFVFEKLVSYLHDFARDVSLTTEEWKSTIRFLTETGKICTNTRQEFILLSDILGLSSLVDSMNHPVVPPATEATVLGPFFTEDAKDVCEATLNPSDICRRGKFFSQLNAGESIASEGKGEYMWCEGQILDIGGKPVPNCKIETWETDEDGFYDTQYEGRTEADCRGRLMSDEQGRYSFRAVLPTPYPIPNDGPVGTLLRSLNRHVFRPAHLHMMLSREGMETLTTALYFKGDPFLHSDAVFGVKSSLVVDPTLVEDDEKARKLGFKKGPYWHLKKDFVLLKTSQAEEQKRKSLANYYASLQ